MPIRYPMRRRPEYNPGIVNHPLLSVESGYSLVVGDVITNYKIGNPNHKLVVVLGAKDTAGSATFNFSSPTWNGQALNGGGLARRVDANTQILRIYYLDAPTPGSGAVNVNVTGGTAEVIYAAAMLLEGTAGGLGTGNTNTGATSPVTSSLNPTQTSFLVSAYSCSDETDLDPTGDSQDLIFLGTASPAGAIGVGIETIPSGSKSFGWGSGGTNVVIAGAAFSKI